MWTSPINMALELIQWLIIGFLLILPLLYELSNTFRYYAKFSLYYALVMLISTIVIIYGVFRPRDTRNHGFVIMAMKLVKRLYGIEIEIRGKENLKSEEPFILMCNHQSSLDVLGMFEIWPDRCVSLMKKELIYAGPFGPAAWLCHAIFIDRLNHEKAIETLQATAKTLQEKKLKVYIFPEGTRNYGGSIASFKKGGFHLAIQAQV
ncbi:hypothetical protein CHS0354_011868 [Potamilus streckersoni]|uniref:1-acyl-sn-glycerol-3-phosphate acyltransferase n=1 Tax=Potamilus streckersoni TaxID=2493646 RepID=A0AAE0T6I2_9BIVA|nr:hypothetical protein CHS0354_011868 [Potamilus streckersoni]